MEELGDLTILLVQFLQQEHVEPEMLAAARMCYLLEMSGQQLELMAAGSELEVMMHQRVLPLH